jgi:uncharacterized protein with FMN-binding domain
VPTPLIVAAEPEETVISTTRAPDISTTSTTTTTVQPSTTIALAESTDGAEVFMGTRVYTNWGWAMVEISVVDDVMVDIEMVMIPRATKRSVALTEEYEPVLRNQALTTQSPDVDIITGATVLAQGYRSSLFGAMKAAGLWPAPEE